MNWISSQSEQELRISMNKLGEDMGIHGAGRWLRHASCASVSSSLLCTLLDLSGLLLAQK